MISPLLGKILEEYNEGNNRIGMVEFGGKRRPIYLYLVPEAHAGDYVKFHAGFATECVLVSDARPAAEQPVGSRGAESRKSDLETLHAYRLLSELDPRQLRKLLPLALERQFDDGQIIFHSGERSLFLHLIVSGEVALEEDTGDRLVPFQTLHAGDAMGWSALKARAQTHFQARALTLVSTVALPGEQLRAACDSDPALGYALMKQLVEMLTERIDAVRMKLPGHGEQEVALAAGRPFEPRG